MELRIGLAEQDGGPPLPQEQMEEHPRPDVRQAPQQSASASSQDPTNVLPQDSQYQSRYVAWRDGLLSNHQVAAELGEDMVALFWSQWLVETEEIVPEGAGLSDEEGPNGAGLQEQCDHPASPCSDGPPMPTMVEDVDTGGQGVTPVDVVPDVRADDGRSPPTRGSQGEAGFHG